MYQAQTVCYVTWLLVLDQPRDYVVVEMRDNEDNDATPTHTQMKTERRIRIR